MRDFGLVRRCLVVTCFIALPTYVSAANAEETARVGKHTMTLASPEPRGLYIVDIVCDGAHFTNHCILSGTHIYRSENTPAGGSGDPSKTCYIELGTSELDVKPVGQNLVSEEGPSGGCETSIISTINFKDKRYSQRKFSNLRAGAFCAAQRDRFTQYGKEDLLKVRASMQCSDIEVITSLWFP